MRKTGFSCSHIYAFVWFALAVVSEYNDSTTKRANRAQSSSWSTMTLNDKSEAKLLKAHEFAATVRDD